MLRLFIGLMIALTLASPAAARWREARSTNFIVYSEGTEAQLRDLVGKLEDFDALLRHVTGITAPPLPNPLKVYLVASNSELRSIRDVGPDVLGVYMIGPREAIVGAVRNDSWGLTGAQVLLHEYAHHFMLAYSSAPYPAWYVEGFAEFFETAEFKDNAITYGRIPLGRAATLTEMAWLPSARLMTVQGAKLSREDREMFYAEAWLATHYLFADATRQHVMPDYIRAIAAGTPPDQAFTKALGTDYASFDKALHQYTKQSSMPYWQGARSSAAKSQLIVRVLGSAESELVLASAALTVDPGEKTGASLLARVRTIAARTPDDPAAMRVLARAEASYGDANVGAALADRLIAADPRDVDALYVRGVATLRQAGDATAQNDPRLAQARTLFARAHKIDPNNVPVLIRYLEASPSAGSQPTDNDLNIAMLAQGMAPQLPTLGLRTAWMLSRVKRFDEARAILQPIATNPHGGDLADRAQQLIAAIDAKTPTLAKTPPAP